MKNSKHTRRSARVGAVAVLISAAAFVVGFAIAPQAASAHAYLPCHVSTCSD